MNRNYILGGIAILLVILLGVFIGKRLKKTSLPSGPVTTQAIPSAAPIIPSQPIQGRPQVIVTTPKGEFTIELRPDLAPQTVANFLAKWNVGYCNNLTFHRVEDWVVQGCDPAGNGTGGQTTLPTEVSSESFTAGAVGVARKTTPKEFSNDSQFFIVKKDSPFLDREYTLFGRVISGMEVVNRLSIGDLITSTFVLSK